MSTMSDKEVVVREKKKKSSGSGGSSAKRYQERRRNGLAALNRQRRATRHKRRMAWQSSKHVKHGKARALRRKNIVQFKRDQEARRKLLTGTIKVNAPSLEMLGQYIGRA